ncbi:MAG: hypothetical protein AAF958_07950 [Planctomycetota bacterium]
MSNAPPPKSLDDALRRLAGYLNFSDGRTDAATLRAWNDVYAVACNGDPLSGMPAWLVVHSWLGSTLADLAATESAFANIDTALRVMELTWSKLLPSYLDFHRDLLFHQQPELVFNGFFLGKAAAAILAVGDRGDEASVAAAIDRMDDYVGYRPVAVLEGHDGQPYRNESICPVPLYVKGVGLSAGPYRRLLELALDALRDTDPDILHAACFDLERLDEIGMDTRAYDFDHPVNRRPNYHFGGWDPRRVDDQGYFTRFVVRQVTLDSLLSRLADDPIDPEEGMVEAALVLGGTILMASGISGWGPAAYDSTVTLGSLMKPIAGYRDAYYADRLQKVTGAHGRRLAQEARQRHQPFGGVRQHLNATLARRRAAQLQHVQLARLYARMGFPDAAKKQADEVAAVSARMMCRIDCLLTLGLRALRGDRWREAAEVPRQAFELIHRAIHCGALVDPWNMLGFGGNFPLYPGPESSVHDSRVDDLLYLVEQLFGFVARVWSEAAARDDAEIYDAMEAAYRDIADWWRSFAAHTVDSIEATDPLESYDSAKLVARALRYWHRGGAESGDIKFWAGHAEWFDSPRAYALVISALLQRGDEVASMALLVHWMNAADRVGLRSGGSSLPRLSERWLLRVRSAENSDPQKRWETSRRFFDYLEANAEEFWEAPRFQIGEGQQEPSPGEEWEDLIEAVDQDDVFSAAYENMSYRDTTDDGFDGSVFDGGGGTEGSRDELEAESKRLVEHLSFLQSLARMWSVASDIAVSNSQDSPGTLELSAAQREDRLATLRNWAARARSNRIGLLSLLDAISKYPIDAGGADKESMRSYDRMRVLRDSLMERVIGTAVEMADARRLVCAAMWALTAADRRETPTSESPLPTHDPLGDDPSMKADDASAVQLLGGLVAGDRESVSKTFPALVEATLPRNLLYIPLSRGGDPVKIFVARLRQRLFQHLLHWLPRRGLVAEACRLIEVARQMEQNNPIGAGAVTEFDAMFRAGFQSLVESLVESMACIPADAPELDEQSKDDFEGEPDVSPEGFGHSPSAIVIEASRDPEGASAERLIPLLEQLTEVTLGSWLAHSQTLRLSPLESVTDRKNWVGLCEFCKKYGDPIFTQTFLQLGNIRAILHQGVFDWLRRVVDEGDPAWADTALVADLDTGKLSLADAERWITLVYESLIDHHAEYLDYNSTTTQSDRGELIYTFLDFLRLRVKYDRIAWNLRPVMWAHEVLVQRGWDRAAMMWRRSLSERIGKESEIYVQKLGELQKRYAMRMPTVADRILERFLQPMTIDRMRALVGPAMRDAEAGRESRSFFLLEQEAELLTRNPVGVGLDVPQWLDSLEEEVEKIAKAKVGSEIDPGDLVQIPISKLDVDRWSDQLSIAKRQGRRLPHMRGDG